VRARSIAYRHDPSLPLCWTWQVRAAEAVSYIAVRYLLVEETIGLADVLLQSRYILSTYAPIPRSLSLTPYPTNPSTFSSYRFVYTSSTSNGSSGLARYLAAGLQKARILLEAAARCVMRQQLLRMLNVDRLLDNSDYLTSARTSA